MNVPAIAIGLVVVILLALAAVYAAFGGCSARERLYAALGVVAISMWLCGVAFFALFYGSGAVMAALVWLGVE